MSAPVSLHVAGLAIAVADIERAAGDLREQLQRRRQAHARAAADVVDAPADPRRDPGRAGGGDDVADEGEVARLAAVAEDARSGAARRPPRRSAGTPCRAAGAGRRRRSSAGRRCRRRGWRGRAAQLLGRELASRRRGRAAAASRPRASAALGLAVDRRRRRVDEARARASADRLEQPLRGGDVVAQCSGRSARPSSSARPARPARWKTTSQPSSRSRSVAARRGRPVTSSKRVVVARACEVARLSARRVVVVEAVDADDVAPVGEQRLGEVRADEARRSR